MKTNKYKKVKRKIQQLYNNEKYSIISKRNGIIYVGEMYKILFYEGEWGVFKQNTLINSFGSSSVAMSWCIADMYNKFMICDHLINADNKLASKKNDIIYYKALLNKYTLSSDRRNIILSKLTNDLLYCKSIENEINKYFKELKNIYVLTLFNKKKINKYKGSKHHGIKRFN